jgi:hypothetical protein
MLTHLRVVDKFCSPHVCEQRSSPRESLIDNRFTDFLI